MKDRVERLWRRNAGWLTPTVIVSLAVGVFAVMGAVGSGVLYWGEALRDLVAWAGAACWFFVIVYFSFRRWKP